MRPYLTSYPVEKNSDHKNSSVIVRVLMRRKKLRSIFFLIRNIFEGWSTADCFSEIPKIWPLAVEKRYLIGIGHISGAHAKYTSAYDEHADGVQASKTV
jgi:hypothetical protein